MLENLWLTHFQLTTPPWWIRMLRIEERHLGFIGESPLCRRFKPKGRRPIVPVLFPPTSPLSLSSFAHFCFPCCFFFLVSVLPLFSFSLITRYLPLSTHRLRLWRPFIRSKPHFPPQYLFRGTVFSSDAKLLLHKNTCSKSISTSIYNLQFTISPPFIQCLFFLSTHCFLLWVIRNIDLAPFRGLEQGQSFCD